MKKENLLALLGEMDDEWILEAMQPVPGRRGPAASLDGMERIADEGSHSRRDCAAAADGKRPDRAAIADDEYRVLPATRNGTRQSRMASGVGQRLFAVTEKGACQGRAAAGNGVQRVFAANSNGAHRGRRVRTVLLAAALLMALAGAAMAAARSGLLDALFSRARIEPNPAARDALVINDAGATTDGYGYEIAESLRDGQALYLNVSAKNESGEVLIFYGPFLTGGILPQGEPYGMVLGGEAAEYAGDQLRYELTEDASDDLSATATVYVLRPTARMIDTDDSAEVNVHGEPLILWEKNESRLDGWYGGYLREKDGSEKLGSEGFTFGGMRTQYSFDDALTKALSEAEGDGEAMVRVLCEHGYVEKVDALAFPISFRDGGAAVEYAVSQPEAELSDSRVNFLRLSVSPVESRLEFELIQNGDTLEAPMFALYVDGERIADAICGQRPRYSSDGIDFSSVPTGEHDYNVTWTSRANPPSEIRLVPMENLAEERPGEAIVWRVQAAE